MLFQRHFNLKKAAIKDKPMQRKDLVQRKAARRLISQCLSVSLLSLLACARLCHFCTRLDSSVLASWKTGQSASTHLSSSFRGKSVFHFFSAFSVSTGTVSRSLRAKRFRLASGLWFVARSRHIWGLEWSASLATLP